MKKPMPKSVLRRLLLVVLAAAALFCLGASAASAGCSKSVVLYNASWCSYCKQVRAILARNNIKYRTLDATTPAVQVDMIRRFGDTAVPRILIGGELVEGVDEARIKQLCRPSSRSSLRQDAAASPSSSTWRGNTGAGEGSFVEGLSLPSAPSAAKVRAEPGTPSWSSSLPALSGTTG
jgi:glutaredoxin